MDGAAAAPSSLFPATAVHGSASKLQREPDAEAAGSLRDPSGPQGDLSSISGLADGVPGAGFQKPQAGQTRTQPSQPAIGSLTVANLARSGVNVNENFVSGLADSAAGDDQHRSQGRGTRKAPPSQPATGLFTVASLASSAACCANAPQSTAAEDETRAEDLTEHWLSYPALLEETRHEDLTQQPPLEPELVHAEISSTESKARWPFPMGLGPSGNIGLSRRESPMRGV